MESISRQVKYQRKHKELGLCQLCPEKAIPGRTHCATHLHKRKLWRERSKEEGNGKDAG